MKLKNIPNILSVIRILLIGVFIYTFFEVNEGVAMIVFLVAGATDVVDGYLARRNNWITDLGKVLDPLADKLMQFTVLICLYIEHIIPIWFVIPFFAKDLFTLVIGLVVIRRRGIVVVSKWYGKMTICLFYATIVLSVIMRGVLEGRIMLTVLFFAPAAICAVLTVIAYVKHYWGLKNQAPCKKGDKENIVKKEETV